MGKKKTLTKELLSATPEAFEIVLEKIVTERSGTPFQICTSLGLSWGGVLAWVNQDPERQEKFKFAMEVRAHLLAEEAITIADGAKPKTVNVAKLRVDTRKWMASRLNPKQYGEKQEVNHSGVVHNLFHVLSDMARERDVTPKPEQLEEAA